MAVKLGEDYSLNEELQALDIQRAVFLLGHNADPDAVDLLEEVVDENTYTRVCVYMIR